MIFEYFPPQQVHLIKIKNDFISPSPAIPILLEWWTPLRHKMSPLNGDSNIYLVLYTDPFGQTRQNPHKSVDLKIEVCTQIS